MPFWVFSVTTLVGLLPYTTILIKTGLMLDSVSHIGFDANVSMSVQKQQKQMLVLQLARAIDLFETF